MTLWAQELANEAKCSVTWVYRISRKLGRRATLTDIVEYRKRPKGRPIKYK